MASVGVGDIVRFSVLPQEARSILFSQGASIRLLLRCCEFRCFGCGFPMIARIGEQNLRSTDSLKAVGWKEGVPSVRSRGC